MVGYTYTEPGMQAVSVIFDKLPIAILQSFSPFWLKQTFSFSDVLN